MGFGEFLKSLAQVIGWALIILAFGLYVMFQEYLESLPKYIVVFGAILVLFFGLILVLYRNTSRVRSAKKEERVVEKIVHITPMDELKHDALALLAFGMIIIWVIFTGETINGNDLAQAGIAYLGVMLVRKIYKERYY